MGIKVQHKTKSNTLPEMIKRLKGVDGTSVEAGVLKGEHAWLAGIHEYG